MPRRTRTVLGASAIWHTIGTQAERNLEGAHFNPSGSVLPHLNLEAQSGGIWEERPPEPDLALGDEVMRKAHADVGYTHIDTSSATRDQNISKRRGGGCA